jgi:hypothetical protein
LAGADSNPHLDFKLFEKMPLLGAYMIGCTEPLDIVQLSQVEFGAKRLAAAY